MQQSADVRIVEARVPDDLDVVRTLFTEYQAAIGVDLCFQGFDGELAGLPGKYARPRGNIWLGLVDGEPGGIVALRPLDDPGAAEMKRLFLRPAARGLGLGRALAERCVAAARGAGYALMRLDTLETMQAAQRIYRELGFRNVEAYYHNPLPGAVYMELDLTNHRTVA
jgi:ribosomal protein S18 acetylase RimI-like enzyme